MDMAFGRHRKRRQHILRRVYEDNLRMTGRSVPEGEHLPPPPPILWTARRRRRLAAWVVTVAVVLGGFAYGGLYASSKTSRPTATPPTTPRSAAYVAPAPEPPRRAAAFPVATDMLANVPDAEDYRAYLSNPDLPLADLFGLQVRTIVIDPGHGGADPGAIGARGTYEKDIVLDVARRLKARLEQRTGYRILMTREADVKVPLKDRVAFANRHEADLFISLHVNELPVDSVTMVETYYFGPHTDAAALRSARRENQDSDYTMADFREVIEGIGNTVRIQESRHLAAAAQRSLYRNLRRLNPELSSWGVKTAPFVVLLGVKAPAVLTEISVLSNPNEESRLRTHAHRERLAAFLEEGLVTYLSQRLTTNEPALPPTQHGKKTR